MPLTIPNNGLCTFCGFHHSIWPYRGRSSNALRLLTTGTALRRVSDARSREIRKKSSERNRPRPPRELDPSIRSLYQYLPESMRKAAQGYSIKDQDKKAFTRWDLFEETFKRKCGIVLQQLKHEDSYKNLLSSLNINNTQFRQKATELKMDLHRAMYLARTRAITGQDENPIFYKLKNVFLARGDLEAEIRYLFYDSIIGSRFSQSDIKNQKRIADCRYPTEWYPATRAMQRKIILHVGPTNSGKTYHALKKLEQAESGIYAGPLRLLAHEVYTRFNAKGKLCSLITGEEQRHPEGMSTMMSSCTVEMVPLNYKVDVAVIDEIQMMDDVERGWAWTQAFIGVQAKEVHLCGEARSVPLIKEICAYVGDTCELHEYERLSPLTVELNTLQDGLRGLRKGDGLVLFSRDAIHAMKRAIEKIHSGKRCAVVYGSLPPEVRAQQAELFNNPDNEYDFLAASNAIGMGLNLSVKRIIFETIWKYDGTNFRQLEASQIKQIAGRAGRFRSARQAVTDGIEEADQSGEDTKSAQFVGGLVTTFDEIDLKRVSTALKEDLEPITSAKVYPPAEALKRFADFFPANTPLSYILLRFQEFTQFSPRFSHASYKDHIPVADAIQDFDLTLSERLLFTAAPVKGTRPEEVVILQAFAKRVADKTSGALLDIPEVPLELLDHISTSKWYLAEVEKLHHTIVLYLWLSYRFPHVFTSQSTAFLVCKLVEEKIEKCLENVEKTPQDFVKAARQRAQRGLKYEKEQRERIANSAEDDEVGMREDNWVPEDVVAKMVGRSANRPLVRYRAG